MTPIYQTPEKIKLKFEAIKEPEGKIYGGITCYKQRDMILIDGHHAVSILYHLGHESVPIIVTKYENTALPS